MAGSAVGNLAVIISANASGLTKGLQSAASEVRGFVASTSSAVGKIAGGFGTFGLAVNGVKSALDLLGGVTAPIQLAAEFEQSMVAFETMLGSADAAKKMLEDLTKFAAATPFEMRDLTAASQRLMAFGFEAHNVIPMLQRLGDIAAAMPEGAAAGLQRVILALGQMRGKMKVQAGEMLQLTEAGVPAWEALAKVLGTDVATAMKRVEAGEVGAAQGIRAVLNLAESDKFRGMMEKQSRTLGGLWSTLKDNASLAMRDLGLMFSEAFDLKGMADKFIALTGLIRSNIGAIKPIFVTLGEVAGAFVDVMLSGVQKGAGLFTPLIDAVQKFNGDAGTVRARALDLFQAIAEGVVTVKNQFLIFSGKFVGSVVEPIVKGFEHIVDTLGRVASSMSKFPGLAVMDDFGAQMIKATRGIFDVRLAVRDLKDGLTEVDPKAGLGDVRQFFDDIRTRAAAAAAATAGIKTAAAAIDLSSLDAKVAKTTKMELPEAMAKGSAKAYEVISRFMFGGATGQNAKLERIGERQYDVQRSMLDYLRQLASRSGDEGVGVLGFS